MAQRMLFLSLILLLLPLTAAADFYSWVDGSGNQNFADSLAKVPEEYRSQARRMGQRKEPAGSGTASGTYDSSSPRTTYSSQRETVQRDQDGHDEKWWRGQVNSLRSKITEEENNLAFYDTRQKACEEEQKNYVRYSRNCTRQYEESRKRSEWNIDRYKQQLEVELPEQARKAGAPPGWVRE